MILLLQYSYLCQPARQQSCLPKIYDRKNDDFTFWNLAIMADVENVDLSDYTTDM